MGPDNRRTFPEERSQQPLPGVRIRMSEEGARRQILASERYRRDAVVLETALATETDPFLISRYTFYLAQSWRDCDERKKALVNYLKRAELGYWDQEVFISLYQAANLKADLGYDAEDVLATYLRAHDVSKDRCRCAPRGGALPSGKRTFRARLQVCAARFGDEGSDGRTKFGAMDLRLRSARRIRGQRVPDWQIRRLTQSL